VIYENFQETEALWRAFVAETIGPDASLMWVSRYSASRRVFCSGGRVWKVRRIVDEPYDRSQSLAGEYEILQHLAGVRGVCSGAKYDAPDGWEVLSYDEAPGRTLQDLLIENPKAVTGKLLRGLRRVLCKIHRRGVAHRDLRPDNILVGPDGAVTLLDFDQAVRVSTFRALLLDGFGIGGMRVWHSYHMLLRQHRRWYRCLMKPARLARRLLRRRNKGPAPVGVPDSGEGSLSLLAKAWRIAQQSKANAPGQRVAYYSFDACGQHFPGERPWALRWGQIAGSVDFAGKRVLELGCNLGMFSSFARKSGATACTGVDAEADILDGARLVAEAMGVENVYRQINFDSPEDWESELEGNDLVFALSVVNWVEDRERFMKFLGRHRECIFEGHGPDDEEQAKLREVGFDHVDVIAISERNRPVYLATRS
jgi:SAM-dependent methyltransferase